jgi:hypothetical protein
VTWRRPSRLWQRMNTWTTGRTSPLATGQTWMAGCTLQIPRRMRRLNERIPGRQKPSVFCRTMALTKHLQALVQFTTHKCCLAGKMPEEVRARNRASCHLCQQARPRHWGYWHLCGGPLPTSGLSNWRHGGERLLAGTPDGLTVSGLPLWNERLISQLTLGIATRGCTRPPDQGQRWLICMLW